MNFSPPETLKKRAFFLRAAARGQKIASAGMVVQILPTAPGEPLRVGYTTTKKLGNAVARNRARRRLREAARLTLAGLNLTQVDLVLIGRHDTAKLPFPQLCAALRQTVQARVHSQGSLL
ncbi:MAG: ribonuclease P protein component [Rhodospirillales bacterium 20-60-12]|nr:MAG: ribonuclease P protein component [Rhodospirillales bacterium 20-60-12]HQT66251.1 ribonuclease P protein component [Acetobacteraceae bacterium]